MADPLSSLNDIILPPVTSEELLAAAALGIVLVLVLSGLLRLVATRKPRPAELLKKRLAELAALPDQERLARQAALMKELAIPLPEDLRSALYVAEPTLRPDRVDQLILAGKRR